MRLRKNKKAISPLIATVLLIGFAIALAVMVYFWWGNILREQLQKTSQGGQAQLVCAEQVELNVKDSSCFRPDDDPSKYYVILYVENKGVRIDDLRVRIVGDLSSTTVTLGDSIKKTQSKQTSINYDASSIGTIQKVVVEPIIIRGGQATHCSQQQLEVRLNPCP